MTKEELRAAILKEAESWIGTRFRNNCAVKGAGTDCAGLLVGVFRAVGVAPGLTLPKYSPQHMLHSSEEAYVEYLKQYMEEILEHEVAPGDVILYKSEKTFSHSAIVVDYPRQVLHATRDAGVIRSHAIKDNLLQGRPRRYFSPKLAHA